MKIIRNFSFIATVVTYSHLLFAAPGALIIAHGSMNHDHSSRHNLAGHCMEDRNLPWEKQVLQAANQAQSQISLPVEVAFGMWETACYQKAIEKLNKRLQSNGGLTELTVVPLFISTYSSVVEMQKYIFGLESERPLPIPVEKIKFDGKIHFLKALDSDPIVSKVLQERAQNLVTLAQRSGASVPSKMKLFLTYHGPVSESENHLWLAEAHLTAARLSSMNFDEIRIVSLRDDAKDEIRDRETRRFRSEIETTMAEGKTALVLPVLLSKDGIEKGILERLENLNYTWSGEVLLPHPSLVDWIVKRINFN